MNKLIRILIVGFTAAFMPLFVMAGPVLSGNAFVNVTSDTAVTAKNMAFMEARRQIITDALSNYTNSESLQNLLKDTKDVDLINLVISTTIESEQQSASTYSANIKITYDTNSVEKWLGDNNVTNWLAAFDKENTDKMNVIVEISGGLKDWIELSKAFRESSVQIDVKKITSGQITLNIPLNRKPSFVVAINNAGWGYSDNQGFLRVWKK